MVITVNPRNFETAASRLLEDKVGLGNLFRAQKRTAWYPEIARLCKNIRIAANATVLYSYGGEGILEYSRVPHVKRKIRIPAGENLATHGILEASGTKMINVYGATTKMEVKQKPREFGKAPKIHPVTGVVSAKPARAIVNAGTEGSLANGHGVEEWKTAFSAGEDNGYWFLRKLALRYVKAATREVLDEVWQHGATTTRPRAAVSGDDSIHFVPCTIDTEEDRQFVLGLPTVSVQGRVAVVLPVVMDISCCDLSVGDEMFESVKRSFPESRKSEFDNLFMQARQPCTMGKGKGKLTFVPTGYFMYSGWGFTTPMDSFFNTTAINHIYRNWRLSGVSQTMAYIRKRAKSCGAAMDIRFCRRYEEADFLKTNPVMTMGGQWTAVVNYGTVLRTLGQCDGDLPGSGRVDDRGVQFNADVVRSMEHSGESHLLRTLRAKYPRGRQVELESGIFRMMTTGSKEALQIESEVNRYRSSGLEVPMYLELCTLLEACRPGEMICTDAVKIIMGFDYGYV